MSAVTQATGDRPSRLLPCSVHRVAVPLMLVALIGGLGGVFLPTAPTDGLVGPRLSGAQPIAEAYGKLPVAFEANLGQADPTVRFLAHGTGYELFLTDSEAVMSLHSGNRVAPMAQDRPANAVGSVVRMQAKASQTRPEITASGLLPGSVNYLLGSDPAGWRTGIPTYSRVAYHDLYPGIDLVYHSAGNQLEEDFVIAPGSNPSTIRLGFQGADRMVLGVDGGLAIEVAAGTLQLRPPQLYQQIGTQRHAVQGSYLLKGPGEASFRIGAYDHHRPLVIDPVLTYSTYLGGSDFDSGRGIAVDGSGTYVTGFTRSTDFPTTNPAQATSRGRWDAFVTKLNQSGTAREYSTYLGGSGDDFASGIVVDGTGSAYVTGYTSSADFPMVSAYQATLAGHENAFVAKLNATGNRLLYSTYLGGRGWDHANGIAVDSAGSAYVTGVTGSDNFPTTTAIVSWGNTATAFVSKLSAAGNAVVYSTYVGAWVTAYAIAVDSGGKAYITGDTLANLPTKNPFQSTFAGCADAFIMKVNQLGNDFVYSTYLRGATSSGNCGSTYGRGIAADANGNAYVTGFTDATDFPTMNPFQAVNHGGSRGDVFVTKFNPDGSALLYSTYLGGAGDDVASGIAVDVAGNAYVTGYTTSSDFPLANPVQSLEWGGYDAFVAELSPAGGALVYSTYLGGSGDDFGYGIAVDGSANTYITGQTNSANFPTSSPVQAGNLGGADAFVAKLSAGTSTPVNHPPSTVGTAFPISSADGDDTSGKNTIATDGTNFLIVWQQASAPVGIYGERVTYDGQVLDPQGFRISDDAGADAPAVAFDGTNYMVVWISGRCGCGTNSVYGVRVTPARAVLDAAPIQLTDASAKLRMATVAFDGTNYMTAWRDVNDQIRVVRFTPAGVTLDPTTGIALGHGYYPYVAYGGGKYLVVWHDGSGYCACYIVGAFVATNGTVATPAFAVAPQGVGKDHSSAAFDGTNFLVVWHDFTGSGGSDTANGATYGARVSATALNPVLDAPFKIGDYTRGQGAPRVAFDGTNYMVVWFDDLGLYKWRGSGAFGRRVSPAGVVLDAHPMTIDGSTGDHFWPVIGYGGGRFLVAWRQLADAAKCPWPNSCVYARVVPASGSPSPPLSSTTQVAAGWTVAASLGNIPLYSIAGWSANDVYAIGYAACPAATGPLCTYLAHRDASGWTLTSNTDPRQFASWATAPHSLWTVGSGGDIRLLDGTGWHVRPGLEYPGSGTSIWGTGTSGYTIMVGTSGNFHIYDPAQAFCPWNRDHPGDGCIGHVSDMDPLGWKTVSSGVSGVEFFGVWGTASSNAYAVGEFGTIVHWDGSQATPVAAIGGRQALVGIWGSGPADIFAVGDGGTIVHYNGSSWGPQATPTAEDLTAIWGSSSSDVFAVGRHGTLLHYDGSTWVQQSSPSAVSLYGIWGGTGTVFAVGDSGTVLALPHLTVPAAPTAVTTTAGNQQVSLTWTAPDNGGSAITGYTVTPTIGSSAQTPILTGSATTGYTVTGLTPGTTYTFTVAAINSVGTGAASAASNAVTPAGVIAVASLPAMANAAYGGYSTRTYIQNRGNGPARVNIVYRDSLGVVVGAGDSNLSLPVSALWEVRQDNGNGLASGQAGSAIIFSDQPLASFVNEFPPGAGDATSYTGVQIGPGTGASLFAPTIAKNAYGGYTTGIGLLNQGSGPTDVTITYRNSDGSAAGSPQVLAPVAAGAYRGVYTGDVTSLPDGFAGSATITSSNGSQLAAIVNETGPGGQFSSYDTVPSGSASLFAPTMLKNAYGGYNTGLALVETAGVSGTVSITYYDSQGTAYAHPDIPIAAHGFLGVYQGAGLLAPPSDGAYTARITTGGGAVVSAIVNEVAAGGTMSTSYNTFAAGTSTVNLPLVENAGADGLTTGVGIMNTGSAQTTVTLSYFDPTTGGPIGTPQLVTLAPGATAAIYQGDPNNGLGAGTRAAARLTASNGGLIAVICNEIGTGVFMSYVGR